MNMLLRIYPFFKGVWIAEKSERKLDSIGSTLEIGVEMYSSSNATVKKTNGILNVCGTDFEVKDGRAVILTEVLNDRGESKVMFSDQAGVIYPCASICINDGCYYFSEPRESLSDGELFGLICELDALKKKVAELSSACASPVSSIIGI